MKTLKTNGAKRAMSFVLAFAMLLGSLFIANVGININVAAATENVVYYSGGISDGSFLTDGKHGSGTDADPYIISTPEELRYVHQSMTDTSGKYFKIADGIDSFVLQPKTKIDANGGYDMLKNLTASEVNTWFSSNSLSGDAWNNWHASNNYFAGTLDFNGITIYGMSATGSNVALISRIKGGTLKNVTVKSSYVSTTNYGAIIAGQDNSWSTTTYDTFENIVVANCYVVTSKDAEVGSDRYQTAGVFGAALFGNTTVNNCMVYGNIAVHSDGAQLAFIGKSQNNASMFKNSIILDTFPYSAPSGYVAWGTCNRTFFSNVYTDAATTGVTWANTTSEYNYEASQIQQITEEDLTGAFVKSALSALNWATDSTDGDWYAVANAYPTPVRPDGWTDVVEPTVWDGNSADFTTGSGTEADPYIIENAGQLYKMVYDGGKTNGSDSYYKVADGITKIFLNKAESRTGIELLVAGGTYNKWSFDETVFTGKFDGNGVTIYGMVSNDAASNTANVGFIPKLGYNAVIENVIFSAAYVKNYYAAVITTKASSYADNDNDGDVFENSYITNVAVISSHIESTNSGAAIATAAGFIATTATPDYVYFTNCIFDGGSSSLTDKGTDATVSARAGIVSFPNWGNNFLMINCVSIDAYIVPMVTSVAQNTTDGTWYQRYPLARTSKVEFTNCYSDINPVMYNTVTVSGTDYVYDRITNGVSEINVTTEGVYDQKVMPTLDWKNTWSLVEVTSGRFIPMPIKDGIEGDYANYNEILKDQQDGRGANMGTPYANGTYGMLHEFVGSGTETDPYMIYTALDLARAIGCGGVNLNQTLHFKLANDIDLENLPWITQATDSQYTYVAFKGTLDGNGYTVTGLNAGDKNSAGLIPVLAGGTVKNLHVRDSYVGSTSYAGALVGDAQSGTISGCSVEDSVVVSKNADWHIFGSVAATISDLYYIAGEGSTATYDNVYVDESSNLYTDETDEVIINSTSSLITKIKEDANTATWYIGGTDDSTPKLVNRAQTMVYTDIAGDDNGSEYDSNDLIALRRKLLKKSAYANIYGDVTRDGDINIVDLAVLCRQIGGDYGQIEDGFWAAVANNKMAIYYSENDTMDMARTLELYLEAAVNGLDIEKYATSDAVTDPTAVIGTPDGVFDIVLVDSNDSTNYDDYSIEYDEDSAVLTITGGSFTAVEQAVLAFAANSNYATDEICIGSGSIVTDTDTTYEARTVNGTTYYYAWGDEFNTGTSYSQDTWEINDYKSETDGSQSGRYWNKETVGVDDINQLWEITDDGQLQIWRGLDSSVYVEDTHSWGYKSVTVDPDKNGKTDYNKAVDSGDVYVDPGCINTRKSMLFKQGYIEMKATLPSDGHAFPAWWFLTGPSLKYNNYFDATLYNKVYIKNPNWTGVNAMVASDLSTYKYQIPAAHLEYDIVEVMQSPQDDALAKSYLTATSNYKSYSSTYKGTYISYTNLTVHKIYNENVYDGYLYIPDWSEGKSTVFADIDTFVTTATDQFIHNYNTSKYTNEYDFGNINQMQGEHIFGFAWTVDESEGTYTLTVYVDGVSKMTVNQDVGHAATDDPTYVNGDADIWNQYAYMLLDNSFYSSNPYYTSDPSANFTDLLTQESKAYGRASDYSTLYVADKATFEVDYVRVYQQNDMRDIVTDETEAFNNGNRFGYGK